MLLFVYHAKLKLKCYGVFGGVFGAIGHPNIFPERVVSDIMMLGMT